MKRLIIGLIAILAIAVLPWVISTAYVNAAGIVVTGEVIGKREAILMPGGDSWRHTFEVTYRYRPLDSPYRQTASHQVDPTLYHRLQVGSAVQVRYSPSRLLRPMEGVGSFLTGSSPVSRLPYGPLTGRDVSELAALALAALIGFVAYRKKSKSLGLLAAVIAGACFPVLLLAASGLFLFPTLFWGWRRNPGRGYGWALLGTSVLSTAIVYWRIPQPTPVPPGPRRDSTAIVRGVQVVNQIWTDATGRGYTYAGGQGIRQPFQMMDLEFTPEGATEPIHVLDRVDLDSLPGLREGATVPIYYSSADPALARVARGTRTYARAALVYLLGLTYGTGAALAFLIFPGVYVVGKFVRSSQVFSPMIASDKALRQISSLPADDPRRKALEEFMRARHNPQRKGS